MAEWGQSMLNDPSLSQMFTSVPLVFRRTDIGKSAITPCSHETVMQTR